jgi:hypothetical protein
MNTDTNFDLPTAKQIDAILKFRSLFEPGAARGSPSVRLTDRAGHFLEALRGNGFVTEFNWEDWEDESLTYLDLPGKIFSADLAAIQRLFTFHVRKDRFCEGHFASMLKNGHIVLLLRCLAVIRLEMAGGFVLDDREVNAPLFRRLKRGQSSLLTFATKLET